MKKKKDNKTDAVIYCRVSTREQAEHGYSLESQEHTCRKFVEQQGLQVSEVFVERGESAKTVNRPVLNQLLNYVTLNKKTTAAVIIWKIDRLTRNVVDYHQLNAFYATCDVRLLSVTESNEDTPTGRFLRTILSAAGQLDNEQKAERTKNGMIEALKQGRWCWPYPTGYNDSRDDLNKPIALANHEAKYIRRCFELFITNSYRQTDVVMQLHSEGFKRLSKTQLHKILRNPFYAGIIQHEWLEQDVKGLHEPLITKEHYYKAQEILDGKRPVKIKRQRHNPDFPLKGILYCPKCGKKLTAGWCQGRNNKFAYYNCPTKGCTLNIRKELLDSIFPSFLRSIQPQPEYLDLFEAILRDSWNTNQAAQLKEKRRIEREIKALEDKFKQFDNLLAKGLDLEHYNRNMAQIQYDINAKQIELGDLHVDMSDLEECVKYCKYFLSNTAKLWEEGDLTLKQRFQNLIFPSGITFNGESFRTKETALIFSHFQAKTKAEYKLVAPRGIEPRFDD